MASLTQEQLQEALDAYVKCGSKLEASKLLGINSRTYSHRLQVAQNLLNPKQAREVKEKPNPLIEKLAEASAKIRELESTAKINKEETLTSQFIKKKIIQLAESPINPPSWLVRPLKKETTGIPTLFASDWHWAENVDPNQIGGVNEYNIQIAQERARAMIETAIDLLRNHLNNPKYDGIVFALGGDMFSGNIHTELATTNDIEVIPAVLDIWGVLVWCIDALANEFGKVFVPCVSGNHGRNTFKIQAKNRNFTNFDWLLYQFLNKRFEGDKRVQFLIPDGSDAYYSIYNHKYLLTHGDQFRGGDGIIGALGPVIRGDHKKRSRNAQIDMEYDTMICGHWHQLIQLQRLIINGSLKGYDEYAYTNNFGFEAPRQALWITHPEHGITFSCAVNVERKKEIKKSEWIGWTK